MVVSSQCTVCELDKVRDRWMRAFSPVCARGLRAWITDWRSALEDIPYLRLVKLTPGGLLNMIEMRAVMNVSGLHWDMVRADLERVWTQEVATDVRASHSSRETASGIQFMFCALTKEQNYVTGCLYVARKDS